MSKISKAIIAAAGNASPSDSYWVVKISGDGRAPRSEDYGSISHSAFDDTINITYPSLSVTNEKANALYKFDSDGSVLAAKYLEIQNVPVDRARGVILADPNSENCYLVQTGASSSNNYGLICVAKLDINFAILDDRVIGSPAANNGNNVNGACIDKDSNIYIVGAGDLYASGNPDYHYGQLWKLDSDLDTVFSQHESSANLGVPTFPKGADTEPNNSYLSVGAGNTKAIFGGLSSTTGRSAHGEFTRTGTTLPTLRGKSTSSKRQFKGKVGSHPEHNDFCWVSDYTTTNNTISVASTYTNKSYWFVTSDTTFGSNGPFSSCIDSEYNLILCDNEYYYDGSYNYMARIGKITSGGAKEFLYKIKRNDNVDHFVSSVCLDDRDNIYALLEIRPASGDSDVYLMKLPPGGIQTGTYLDLSFSDISASVSNESMSYTNLSTSYTNKTFLNPNTSYPETGSISAQTYTISSDEINT